MPPPSQPFHATGDWVAIERELGTPLPEDYKQFIATYGQGMICKSLWIDDYLALGTGETVWDVIRTYLAQFSDIQKIGVAIPYSVFPQPAGLLPIGGIENGGAINWLTGGPPSEWDVVVWDSDSDDFHRAEGHGLVSFLVELVSMRWPRFASRFEPELFTSPTFESAP